MAREGDIGDMKFVLMDRKKWKWQPPPGEEANLI
jgi:hypothetical protein